MIHTFCDATHKRKTITRHVSHWYTVPLLTLTGVHSLAQTNELLSYISVRYHSVTWLHCSPFPISSFTDCHIAAIFSRAKAVNGQWRTYRRMYVCVYAQKHTDKDMCTPTHRPRCNKLPLSLDKGIMFLAIRKPLYPSNTKVTISYQLLFPTKSLLLHYAMCLLCVSRLFGSNLKILW